MNPTLIFSEDFYNRPLFCNGERVSIAENGSFIVNSPESKWNRFKRFLTFQQDPHIEKVHEQLKTTIDQIDRQSGPIFSCLKHEVHAHGEKEFKCLKMNLNALRKKLDRVGQINLFSSIILKLVNAVRCIFHKPTVELKTYANIIYKHEDFFWMANYSMLLNLSKYVNSSFSINFYNLEKKD